MSSGPPGPPLSAFCTCCGALARAGDRYCGACGSTVASITNAHAPEPTPETELLALRAAQRLLDAGDHAHAITALEAVRAAQPTWPSARVLLGIAYLRAGQVLDAQSELEEAERLWPGSFVCDVA